MNDANAYAAGIRKEYRYYLEGFNAYSKIQYDPEGPVYLIKGDFSTAGIHNGELVSGSEVRSRRSFFRSTTVIKTRDVTVRRDGSFGHLDDSREVPGQFQDLFARAVYVCGEVHFGEVSYGSGDKLPQADMNQWINICDETAFEEHVPEELRSKFGLN